MQARPHFAGVRYPGAYPWRVLNHLILSVEVSQPRQLHQQHTTYCSIVEINTSEATELVTECLPLLALHHVHASRYSTPIIITYLHGRPRHLQPPVVASPTSEPNGGLYGALRSDMSVCSSNTLSLFVPACAEPQPFDPDQIAQLCSLVRHSPIKRSTVRIKWPKMSFA